MVRLGCVRSVADACPGDVCHGLLSREVDYLADVDAVAAGCRHRHIVGRQDNIDVVSQRCKVIVVGVALSGSIGPWRRVQVCVLLLLLETPFCVIFPFKS